MSAKLTLVKEAAKFEEAAPSQPKTEIPAQVEENNGEIELDLPDEDNEEKESLEEYLKNVETAANYYEILGVKIDSQTSEIKSAYFSLAKKYHPDKFHQETDAEFHLRIQNAFTEIARAYDTLKDNELREVYDFKLRKYFESNAAGSTPADTSPSQEDTDKAREEFDQGFDYLMKENYEMALPYLTRAAQLPKCQIPCILRQSLVHASTQRYKAEQEIQAAIKLDSENPSYRIMLAEFYIQFNLLKRAEANCKMLVQFPNNREAEALLDTLAN